MAEPSSGANRNQLKEGEFPRADMPTLSNYFHAYRLIQQQLGGTILRQTLKRYKLRLAIKKKKLKLKTHSKDIFQ